MSLPSAVPVSDAAPPQGFPEVLPPILLRAEGLGKTVSLPSGPLQIFSGLDCCVRRGETLAILGASGSGKSTLLALLAGLDLPTAGEVWLAGEPLSRLDEDGRAALRARVAGFVFQSFHLLPAYTALENVMLPLELQGQADARERALQALAEVGLADRQAQRPRTLSGGEQQRVALARALVGAPQILFADEPTGNLDTRTGARIMDLMFDLNARHGTTLVLVTHDPALAARCAAELRL